MINFRKTFSAILLLAVVGTSLCACGKTDEPAEKTPAEGFGLVTVFEDEAIEDLDSEPEISRGMPTVTQNVLTKLDGTLLSGDAYFYRSLLPEEYRAAYDCIRTGIVDGETEIVMTSEVKKEDIKTVYRAVLYDCPDLFWLEGSVKYGYNKNGIVTKVIPKYNDLFADKAENSRKLEEALKDAFADMWSLDDVQRVKYAHDFLVDRVTYDYDAPHGQTAFGAVCDKTSVCAGYARAFQYMMQRMGIRCGYLVGMADDGETSGPHAWNIVELDGDFYAMDVTWDDTMGENSSVRVYEYYNLPNSVFSADHTRENPSTGLPEAAGTEKSFNAMFGHDFSCTDYEAITGSLPEGYDPLLLTGNY